MSHHCVEIEDLGTIAQLAPDTALRREIDECPRCRALLASYLAFLVAQPSPGSRPGDADELLETFIRQHVEGVEPERSGREERADGGIESEVPPPAAPRRSSFRLLWPRLAPLAAAVVLVVAVALWSPWSSDTPSGVERGEQTAEGLRLGDATVAGGAIALSWTSHPEATDYRVVLYDERLSEIARFGPIEQTHLSVALDELPGVRGQIVWRVFALQRGDEIARSSPGYVEVP
jgi:hypothetical protein